MAGGSRFLSTNNQQRGAVDDGNPTECARLKARPFLACFFLVFPRFQFPVIGEWWYVLLTLRDKRVIW
jgi:hypothetical protein